MIDFESKEVSMNLGASFLFKTLLMYQTPMPLRTTRKSYLAIAKGLTKDRIKIVTGNEKWWDSTISGMLENEKYYGDVLFIKQSRLIFSVINEMKLLEVVGIISSRSFIYHCESSISYIVIYKLEGFVYFVQV